MGKVDVTQRSGKSPEALVTGRTPGPSPELEALILGFDQDIAAAMHWKSTSSPLRRKLVYDLIPRPARPRATGGGSFHERATRAPAVTRCPIQKRLTRSLMLVSVLWSGSLAVTTVV